MARIPDQDWAQFFNEPMHRLSQEDEPPFDFWSYVESIPPEDFEGHDFSAGEVEYVYRDDSGRFEHVLINSERQDVFMVIILDRSSESVVGHKLLNLPRLYGTDVNSLTQT